MAGIRQADIAIKTMIDLSVEDMRRNPWLIQHMLSDLVNISYFKDKYGQKQIDACQEWFKNNQIDVYLRGRQDKDRLPCITISLQGSQEKQDMRTMADQSTETVELMPNQIGKPIPYIVKPFTPIGYDEVTGDVSIPADIDLSSVSVGMILVNPANGEGYSILDISEATVSVEPNLEIEASQLGIVPQFQYFRARIEHSFFEESYIIGCHAHGDPQAALWLWSIVKYSILRYRESLLEANGFAESYISSSPPDFDESFTTPGGETAWCRYITLNCQVEDTWIKGPHRIIESAKLGEDTSAGFLGAITILSNTDPAAIAHDNTNWYATQSLEDEET